MDAKQLRLKQRGSSCRSLRRSLRTKAGHTAPLMVGGACFLYIRTFVMLLLRNPDQRGDLATWFTGIATTSAAIIAMVVSIRDGRSQRESERRRREEIADQEAAVARSMTSKVEYLYIEMHDGGSPEYAGKATSCAHIRVTVTNHGHEPLLGVRVDSVHVSGPYSYGHVLLASKPGQEQVSPAEQQTLSSSLSFDDVAPVLGAGQSASYLGRFCGATESQASTVTLGEGDLETLSAVVIFADGRGNRWRRWAMQPPEKLAQPVPNRTPPGGYTSAEVKVGER